MRKAIFLVTLAVSLITGLIFTVIWHGREMDGPKVLIILSFFLVLIFALFLAFRRLRAVKQQLPAEDEFSKRMLQKGASSAYFVSIYFWLALLLLEEDIPLSRSNFIAMGIMGMAIIFALSWIYHRYIRKSDV